MSLYGKLTLAMALNRRLSVKLIRRPSEARVLYEPMRREILRLLGKTAMTQTQLGKVLGLRAPTVGHHLAVLNSNGFVSVVRQEPGAHGIVEKYYGSTAQLYFIDRKIMPLDVRRYYMAVDIERARGVLACAMMKQKIFDPPSDMMESFAEALSDVIFRVATKYEMPVSDMDPEAFIGRLYCEALEDVLKTSFKELRDILKVA